MPRSSVARWSVVALAGILACTPVAEREVPVAAPHTHDAIAISFEAADGIRVHADLYENPSRRHAPLLLLFHQGGGDARGEYEPIIPRLLEANYQVLAVDQRVGGDRFGGDNRTLAGVGEREFGYCDAYPDLEAALDWAIAQGFDGPRFAWGSSYSAALALRLAAERGSALAGVLAFSPASGEPMRGCDPGDVAPRVTIPALVLRPPDEAQREPVRAQIAAFEKLGIRTHVAANGTHGSSMLVASRVEGNVEPTWQVVLAFLGEHAKARSSTK